jgi:DNA polymerase III delta subunit
MIIYLYGPDSYRRGKKAEELVGVYRGKNPNLDLMFFDFEDEPENWQKAGEFLNQPSMFVSSKLALIKEGGQVAEKEWQKLLKGNLEDKKVFILISDKKKPLKALDFLLKNPVKSQSFALPEGEALFRFLKEEAERLKLAFVPHAWRYFCSSIAASEERSWLAVNELNKISLAKLPSPISLVNLRKVIRYEEKEAVFASARGILRSGNFGQRLGILEKTLIQKESPAYIFNSLGFAASGKVALKLAEYDISIKSGGLEYEEALTDFVLQAS